MTFTMFTRPLTATERLVLALSAIGLALACTPERDSDGDGYNDNGSGPVDCAPNDPSRYPGAPEICNGVDDDCDGRVDEEGISVYPDLDGDGVGGGSPRTLCTFVAPAGYSVLGGDCDDRNDRVRPGMPELCNGIDDNCDDEVDVPAASLRHLDPDGDGYPTRSVELCIDGVLDTRAADCAPDDPAAYPGAPTDDCQRANVDLDCDGVPDCTDLEPPVLTLVATLPAETAPTRFASSSIGAFIMVGDEDPTLFHTTGPLEALPTVGGRSFRGTLGAFHAGGDHAVWTLRTDLGNVLAASDAASLDDDGPVPISLFTDAPLDRVAIAPTDDGVVIVGESGDALTSFAAPDFVAHELGDVVDDWHVGVDLEGGSVLVESGSVCLMTPLALLPTSGTIDDGRVYECDSPSIVAAAALSDDLVTWHAGDGEAQRWAADDSYVLQPSERYAVDPPHESIVPVPGSTVRSFVLVDGDRRVLVNAHGVLYELPVPEAVPPDATWTYLPANSHTLIARSAVNGAAWVFRLTVRQGGT